MAEQYSKVIKAACSIDEAFMACQSAVAAQGMHVDSMSVNDRTFSIKAAEKMSWLSTSWPAKAAITGTFANGAVLITISVHSSLSSLVQTMAKTNLSKVDMLVANIKAILE